MFFAHAEFVSSARRHKSRVWKIFHIWIFHTRAIIAIARMILTAIYQMLSTGEQWNPSDLYKIDMPVALVEKQKAKAIKQAKKLLQREGLLPPDEPLAS